MNEFSYLEYTSVYEKLIQYIEINRIEKPEFLETADSFLQFLYDTNIVCYIEESELEPLFRWCYRERSPSNIAPKVKTGERHRIHYGLFKALNVGARFTR